MRVLLDENLPRKLVDHLPGHDCRTVAACGWAGTGNGELLKLANPHFDVFVTLDKNVPHQVNLAGLSIALLIVRAVSNRIPDLLPIVPECLDALDRIQPGEVLRVGTI